MHLIFFASLTARVALFRPPTTSFLCKFKSTLQLYKEGKGLRPNSFLAVAQTKMEGREDKPLDEWMDEARHILAKTVHVGGFCTGGSTALPCLPGLVVQGVGEISMPLLPFQAQQLKEVGSQAGFGKGPDTVVDRAVRDSIRIDPALVSFSRSGWDEAIQDLGRKAASAMGVNTWNVRAELYQLLLYETGGHFKPHKDTEKSKGMFGTLVVQFPCKFSGGSFALRHNGVVREYPMGADDGSCSSTYHYVAHYADCEHTVRPVTEGHRLVAVYSLCWDETSPPPSLPDASQAQRLAAHLRGMGNRTLGFLLTHEYTFWSLSENGAKALKGHDATIARMLCAAGKLMAQHDPLDALEFCIVEAEMYSMIMREYKDYAAGKTKWHWQPQYPVSLRDSAYGFDGQYVPFDTVKERVEALRLPEDLVNDWAQLGRFQYHDSDELQPCWEYAKDLGYTGNEGAGEDLLYRGYALVFWRKGRKAGNEGTEEQ